MIYKITFYHIACIIISDLTVWRMRRMLMRFLSTMVMVMLVTVDAAAYSFHSFYNLNGQTSHLCIRDITQTSDGMMWFAAGDGLYSYDGYHLTQYRYELDNNGNKEQMKKWSNCYDHIIACGDSLVIGGHSGVLSFDIHTEIFRLLPYANGEVVSGIEMHDGHLWVATDKGVYRDGQTIPYNVNGTIGLGCHGDYIYIGGVGGASRYSTVSNIMESMSEGMEYVSCFTGDKRNLWVGSASSVTLIDTSNGEKKYSIPVPVAKCMLLMSDGQLLVGTDDGLYVLSQDGMQSEKVVHDARYANSLVSNAVWSIFKDKDKNIWIGTDGGISLVKADGAMTIYPLPLITGHGDGNRFTSVFSDSKDRLWLGGAGGLLCVENLDTDKQTSRWYRMNDSQYPIYHNHVRCIVETKTGHILVGGDMGLMVYEEDTRQFTLMRLDVDDMGWIYDIEETKAGSLLLTTYSATYTVNINYGQRSTNVISRHKRKKMSAKADVANSYLRSRREGQEVHFLSAYIDSKKGVTLLGGIDCFAIVKDSANERTEHNGHKVTFTGVMVNGEERYVIGKDEDKRVTLPADMTFVEVMFSDFDYSKLFAGDYQYRLDDGEWLPVRNADNTVMLAILSAGSHVLAVRDTRNGESMAELTMYVTPRWYASTIARILYVLTVCLLAYMTWLLVRQRRRLKREREERLMLTEEADETKRRMMSENMYLTTRLKVQQQTENTDDTELSADEKLLADITAIIKANMADAEFNVDTLCRLSGIGSKLLYRKTKAMTGMTTVAYIRSLRMQKAAALLAKGSMSVSEVMYAVGFSSPSYFTKSFQEEYGVVPSEYRP